MNLKKWAESDVCKAIDKAVGKAKKESRAKEAELFALWESGVSLDEAKKKFGFA